MPVDLATSDSFSVEVDSVDQAHWSEILENFEDASLYQTWPYAAGRGAQETVGRFLLKNSGQVRAAAQVRLIKVPSLRAGVAYLFWGPVWKRRGGAPDLEAFRLAVRAMRVEYLDRRRLCLRIVSQLHGAEADSCRAILEEEGYRFQRRARRRRTILVDLRASPDELYQGLHPKWRYHLNKARKRNMEIIEGEEDGLFEAFERIYAEMAARKKLAELSDLKPFRGMQTRLAPREKMRVFLCKDGDVICAGTIASALGDTGVYMFGATSDHGTTTNGSYLLHWRMLQWVRDRGCSWYDLNGISPDTNHGGYLFKSRLAGSHGRDIFILGQFEAYPNAAVKWLLTAADLVRTKLPRGRAWLRRLTR
jgi:hypothetical protein